MKKIVLILLILSPLVYPSCNDPEPQTETEILTDWIWDTMNEIYLWNEDIDQSLYPTNESDPEAFFYSILDTIDRFSWIVDDYQTLINSFNNIELASGMSPYFIKIKDSEDVVAVIEYVAKGSPAEKAGILRGDIITDINNTTLTVHNYSDLFYSENLTLRFASYSARKLYPLDREVTIVAEVIETNPIQYSEVISFEEEEIGYLVYTGFSAGTNDKWLDSLDALLFEFKNREISNLILDLRYNPGGNVLVAQHLASALAPANIPDGKSVLINFEWNRDFQNYFLSEEGRTSGNLMIPFEELPSNNLNLSTVYILAGNHSASASELTIVGLEPYMNVTHIGEATYGKCYGSVSLKDTEEPPRHEWAMQAIVFKYTNADGYTDFLDGLTPDIVMDDNILEAKQFGDLSDPMLARALEEITGVSPLAKKTVSNASDYSPLPDRVREKKSRAVLY